LTPNAHHKLFIAIHVGAVADAKGSNGFGLIATISKNGSSKTPFQHKNRNSWCFFFNSKVGLK